MNNEVVSARVDMMRAALAWINDAPLSVLIAAVQDMHDRVADDDWVDHLIAAAIESELRARREMGDNPALYNQALVAVGALVSVF